MSETEHQAHLSLITLVTTGTPMVIEQIENQLDHLVPVHRVVDMTLSGRSIERELAMVKVLGKGDNRVEALRLADAFRARVIDATNPLSRGPDGITLEIGHGISGAEKVQGWAAGAAVYKTLNTTGFGNMANPVFKGVKSVMFVAGDDDANKPKVIDLVGQLGFEVVDAGPLRIARLLEPHAMLWIHLALVRSLGRDWAFSIVRR